MPFLQTLAAWTFRSSAPRGLRRPLGRRRTVRLGVEALEARLVPSVSVPPATIYEGISAMGLLQLGGGPRALPDTNVAVGPTCIGEANNDGVRFINKANPGTVVTETFEQVFGPRGNGGYLDPTLNYDESTGNFILTTLNGASDAVNSTLDFAVSSDANPTSFQPILHVLLNPPGTHNPGWGDFDQVGWNKDAYFISMNMAAPGGNYVDILTIRKSDFKVYPLVTLPTWTNPTAFNLAIQPAVMHGDTRGGTMWFVGTPIPGQPFGLLGDDVNASGDTIDVMRMTYITLGAPTFTNFPVAVDPYVAPDPPVARQKGTTVPLDVGDTRMLKAAWRYNRLVATQTVGITSDQATHVRWYEFSTAGLAPTLTQQQTLDPGPGVNTWGASITIDAVGDLGMTYLEASATEYMSMYVTGQAAGMTGLGMEPGQLVQASVGPYANTVNINPDPDSGGARTGDFSSVAVDPTTDSFWAANEYTFEPVALQATDPWDTKIAQFTVQAPYQRTSTVSFGIASDDTLWEYTNGATWREIAPNSFLSVSASTDASGAPEVYGILSDYTLWAWKAATGALAELSGGYFQSISAGPGGLVFAIARDGAVNDLWEYKGTGWVLLSPGNFLSISASTDASGAPEVYGIVSDHTLWACHAATGVWAELSGGYFQSISADPGGLVFAIARDVAVNDLWEYTGTGWVRLSPGNFSSLSAGADAQGNPVVYAIVTDGTLWACHAVTGVWGELSAGNFSSVRADETGDVVGTLADNSVVEYSLAYGGTRWKNLGPQMLAVSVVRS